MLLQAVEVLCQTGRPQATYSDLALNERLPPCSRVRRKLLYSLFSLVVADMSVDQCGAEDPPIGAGHSQVHCVRGFYLCAEPVSVRI